MRRKSFKLLRLIVCVCFLVIFLNTRAFAGNHWLGGSRIETESLGRLKSTVSQDKKTRIFDVVISLDPNTEVERASNNTLANIRTSYENIIKFFADAVFEATEGTHKIGNVYFCPDATQSDKADIVWLKEGHPNANISAYTEEFATKKNIGCIHMFDIFKNGTGISESDLNFLA